MTNSVEVVVAIVERTESDRAPNNLMSLLHISELQQAEYFIDLSRRAQFLSGRGLYRLITGDHLPLSRSSNGTPIMPIGTYGSFSHHGELSVFVTSSKACPIGVDIENEVLASEACREAAFKMMKQTRENVSWDNELWRGLHSVETGVKGRPIVFFRQKQVAECFVFRVNSRLVDDTNILVIALPPGEFISYSFTFQRIAH